MLTGNLTRDPELKFVGDNGTVLAVFGMAVNGWREDDVSFIDCKAWGKVAEVIAQHFEKGRKVAVTGRLDQERWQTDAGENRSKIVVTVEDFDFADSKGGDGGGNNAAGKARSTRTKQADADYGQPVSSEEIPF